MARNFNGSSDLISISGGFAANANALTFSVWFNTTSATNFIDLFSNSSSGDPNNTFSLLQINGGGTGTITFAWRDPTAANAIASSGSTANNGAWHHGAGVQVGLSNRVAYLDGIVGTADTTTVASMANAIDTTRIGCLTRGGSSAGFFPGSIADVACWNVALSQAEIAALANAARPGTIRPRSLQGWWPLGGYGHPALDLSVARKNGVLTGTTFVIGPPLISAAPAFPGVSMPQSFRVAPQISVSYQRAQQILMTGP
jgi:hypothetical protein